MGRQPAGLLIAALLCFCITAPATGQTRRPGNLDALLTAADQFVRLWENNQRMEAGRFLLNDEQRASFFMAREPSFREAKVQGIRFTDTPDRVLVDVSVTVVATEIGTMLPWNIQHEWLFRNRQWRLNYGIAAPSLSVLFPRSATGTPALTSDQETLQKFKMGFRLKTNVIDIPVDAFGKSVQGVLDYEYDGPSEVKLVWGAGPEFLDPAREDLQILKKTGQIRYSVDGSRLFVSGDILPLILRPQYGKAYGDEIVINVRWEGKPHWNWKFTPETVTPDYEGEVRLEVFNQGQETWAPGTATSSAGSLVVKTYPTTPIAPGQAAVFIFQKTTKLPPDTIVEREDITAFLNSRVYAVPIPYPVRKAPLRPGGYTPEEIDKILKSVPPQMRLPRK